MATKQDLDVSEHLGRLLFLDRQPLHSSNVDSGAWDEENNNLYVWFRKGGRNATATTLYVYFGINPVDAHELFGSNSHGMYVCHRLRALFPDGSDTYEKIGDGGAPIGKYREEDEKNDWA